MSSGFNTAGWKTSVIESTYEKVLFNFVSVMILGQAGETIVVNPINILLV